LAAKKGNVELCFGHDKKNMEEESKMEVKTICVVGVGTIGFQIAMLAAQNGHKVTVRGYQ